MLEAVYHYIHISINFISAIFIMCHLPNIVHIDIATMLALFKENKYKLTTTFFVVIRKIIKEMLIIRGFMTRMKLQYVIMGLQDNQCENFNGFCQNVKKRVVDG